LQQPENMPDLIDEIQFHELNDRVQLLLNELTPRQREVFQMSREEGLSHDEISKRLNISVNTVKKHIANTLSFLKTQIDSSLAINLLFVSLFIY
jgi:RNA polymerase sigma-70 factor (ECF subfamily)